MSGELFLLDFCFLNVGSRGSLLWGFLLTVTFLGVVRLILGTACSYKVPF